MIINKGNGLIYEYITRQNRWIRPSSEFIELYVNRFIAQDIGQNYMFVVTYTESTLTCDATICVYAPDVEAGIMIPLGCTSVLNGRLSDLIAQQPVPINPFPPTEEHYYVEDYIDANYIV